MASFITKWHLENFIHTRQFLPTFEFSKKQQKLKEIGTIKHKDDCISQCK